MILSRHAKSSIKLYGITNEEISEAVESPDAADMQGSKTVAIKKFDKRFSGFPLKVVYEKRENDVFIITAYPLKKKLWR